MHFKRKHVKDKDIIWFKCYNCDSKFKSNGDLKVHRASQHNIGKLNCDLCHKRFSYNNTLQRHLEIKHNIGDKKCQVCLNNFFKLFNLNYEKYKNIKSCRNCFARITKLAPSKEQVFSNFLDTIIPRDFIICEDSEINGNKCLSYRPDKLYMDTHGLILHFECDENEHRNKDYSCDEKRISDLYDEFDKVSNYVIIRFNPDKFKIPKEYKNVEFDEEYRYTILSNLVSDLLEYKLDEDDKIQVLYLFYSKKNKNITKNIKHHFIYSEEDIREEIYWD